MPTTYIPFPNTYACLDKNFRIASSSASARQAIKEYLEAKETNMNDNIHIAVASPPKRKDAK